MDCVIIINNESIFQCHYEKVMKHLFLINRYFFYFFLLKPWLLITASDYLIWYIMIGFQFVMYFVLLLMQNVDSIKEIEKRKN